MTDMYPHNIRQTLINQGDKKSTRVFKSNDEETYTIMYRTRWSSERVLIDLHIKVTAAEYDSNTPAAFTTLAHDRIAELRTGLNGHLNTLFV